MVERRAHPRVDAHLELQYQTPQAFLTAYMRNISGGGLFVETERACRLNETLRLRFKLPGIDHAFEIGGLVVWTHAQSTQAFPAGMGIKFVEITPEEVELIERFVRQALAAAPAKTW